MCASAYFDLRLNGLVETVDRFLMALEGIEDQAVVQEYLWRFWGLHCRRDQVQSLRCLALGKLDQLKGVEMVGAHGENGSIEPFGLRRLAAFVTLQRLCERLRQVTAL